MRWLSLCLFAIVAGLGCAEGGSGGSFRSGEPVDAGESVAAQTLAGDVPAALDFTMKSLQGQEVHLGDYAGQVVLIVNTASECGATPQYGGLQMLHEQYAEEGLAILGFPCNQFGGQEPGSDQQIATFCRSEYSVGFEMFSKIEVNGEGQCDLYHFLTSPQTNPGHAGEIKWNFEKFLIDREGKVIARFRTPVKPESQEVVGAIKLALAKER